MGSIAQNCNDTGLLVQPAKVTCSQMFGQIIKMALRYKPNSSRPNTFTPTNILTEATWQGLIDETDGSKIIITEAFGEFTFNEADVVTYGENSNDVPGGLGLILGFNSQRVTGAFLNMPTEIADEYRAFTSISANGLLEAFFFTELGGILTSTVGGNPSGISIKNFVVSPVSSAGLNAPNKHRFYFNLDGQWDNGLKVYTPTAWSPLNLEGTVV